VRKLGFDTRFMRIWEFYLAYCEAAFATGNTNVVQFTLRRPEACCCAADQCWPCRLPSWPLPSHERSRPPRPKWPPNGRRRACSAADACASWACACTTRGCGRQARWAPTTGPPALGAGTGLRAVAAGRIDRVERSLAEMRRQGPIDDRTSARWLAAMTAAFPDVKDGDRLTGLHRPGDGARIFHNGARRPNGATPCSRASSSASGWRRRPQSPPARGLARWPLLSSSRGAPTMTAAPRPGLARWLA
jgi:hypothetical protein